MPTGIFLNGGSITMCASLFPFIPKYNKINIDSYTRHLRGYTVSVDQVVERPPRQR